MTKVQLKIAEEDFAEAHATEHKTKKDLMTHLLFDDKITEGN